MTFYYFLCILYEQSIKISANALDGHFLPLEARTGGRLVDANSCNSEISSYSIPFSSVFS